MEHLAIFHWFSKYNFVCIPVLAFLLDLIIGDPNSKYHPVAIIGRIISFFEAVLYKDTDNDTKKLWYGGIAVGFIVMARWSSRRMGILCFRSSDPLHCHFSTFIGWRRFYH